MLLALGAITLPLTRIQPGATLRASAETEDLPAKITVSDSVSFELSDGRGEVQSTVIAPNQNSVCPKGRLLISDDGVRNPGKVLSIALDNFSDITDATFPTLPPFWQFGEQRILSNDHDLVALPGGEVLLVKMGQSRVYLYPKPVWFDYAYKLLYDKDDPSKLTEAWGPGARSEIFVWRSTDCGKTFNYVSSIDTASVDDGYGSANDGSGGLPQNKAEIQFPGSPLQPVWQMGGTDGPLVRVDPETGNVLITIGLVGERPVPLAGPFWISDVELNRTVVMRSSDKGSSWTQVASLPFASWRLDIVPQSGSNGQFMTVAENGWNPATQKETAFVAPFPQGLKWPDGLPLLSAVAPGAITPWTKLPLVNTKEKPGPIRTNIPGQTLLTRSPSSKNLILAYQNSAPVPGGSLYFYNMYVYNSQSSWLPLGAILPSVPLAGNFPLHVTAVDPGRGPLLFYWYDVNATEKTATIRGKLVTRDDADTAVFAISRTGGIEQDFSVEKARWYGDYHTAGAYSVASTTSQDWQHASYHYYPIWVQPDDDKVYVAHVTFNVPIATTLDLVDIPDPLTYQNLTVSRDRVDATRLVLRRTEEDEPRRVPIR